jgi:hypothetical protein
MPIFNQIANILAMRNSLLSKRLFPFLLLVFQTPLFCQQADTTSRQGIFDLLLTKDVAEITITIDLDSLLDDIRRTDYVKGTFEFEKKKKENLEIPVKVRPRGKFRRMKCNFPPLKLKFKKDDLEEKGLKKYNEFKLVTQCLEDDVLAKEMILKEFLAYKIYSELTPNSFRVQLVRVTFKDDNSSRREKQWGIMIEDLEDLADRTSTTVVSRMGIPLDSLHSNQEKLASLFQYMIGNCDWSYFLCRNMEFIQSQDGKIFPVPYDFDYCGFVNAPYSAPNAQIGQKTVKDRVYLGNAATYEDTRSMFSYFKTKEKAIMKILKDCKQLNLETRSELEGYLAEFFTAIDDEKKAMEIFVKPISGN